MFWVLSVVGLGVAGWLHWEAGFGFPRPWPDESHFLTVASQLARHATLDAPQLNAPDGIFWLPHGYYVLLAPVVLVAGDALEGARWVSFASTVVFAGCVVAVLRRHGVSDVLAALTGVAWLLLPRVVMAADIARMEAPVLALAGVAVLLADRARWPAAVAVGAAAALLHPIGAVVAAVFAAGAVAAGIRVWRRPPVDMVVVAIAVVAVAAQAAYFLAHWDLTVAHLGFQLTRKSGRGVTFDVVRATILTLAVVALVIRRRDATARVLLATSAGLVVVAVVGQEMWYEFLGTETALLLLIAGVLPALQHAPWLRLTVTAAVAAIAVSGAVLAPRLPVFGMRAGNAGRAEWAAFTNTAITQLRTLDAQQAGSQTVLVDPLSGFGHELAWRQWRHLRFVQPTPVTPLTDSDAVLLTPGAPFTGIPQPGEPAVQVTSPTGAFALVLGATR